jgi:hypothetical protein
MPLQHRLGVRGLRRRAREAHRRGGPPEDHVDVVADRIVGAQAVSQRVVALHLLLERAHHLVARRRARELQPRLAVEPRRVLELLLHLAADRVSQRGVGTVL